MDPQYALADAMPLIAWTATPDGRTDFLNRQWRAYTGQDAADAAGGDSAAYMHPDDLPEVIAAWQRRLPGGDDEGADFTFEYRLRRADGVYRWHLGRCVAERDATGRVVRWVGTGTDIDDQKCAERALADANRALHERQAELELVNHQLQEQAVELAATAEQLQTTAAHLEEETQAAESARARAAGVLEATSDAYFALDADFRITGVNAAMERGSGLSRDRLVGQRFWEMFPAAVGTAFERHYRRAAAERVPVHFTHDYSDDRLDLVVDVDAYPAKGGGVAVFWRDVTPRVRAEAALAASDARYKALLASVDTGFCVIEVLFDAEEQPDDYRFLETNAAFERQSGLANVVGRRIREIAPDMEAWWFETYGRVSMTGEPARFENHAAALGRWFDVFAYRVDAPGLRRVAVLFTDVTADKTAAAERDRLLTAERAARRRAEVLQEVTAALSAADTTAEIARVALAAAAEGAGADAGTMALLDATAAWFEQMAQVGLPEPLVASWQRYPAAGPYPAADAVASGAPQFVTTREEYLTRYPAVEASVVALGLEASAVLPLVGAPGSPALGYLGLHYRTPHPFAPQEVAFLTAVAQLCAQAVRRARLFEGERVARREAERERARAEEANQAKSQFLANMSHELRTPLNAIAGYVQLLDMELHGPVTGEQRAALARVQKAQAHLLTRINDILNFAKLEGGRVEYDVRAVDVRDVVAEVTPLVEPQATAKGLALDVRLPNTPCPVWADREKFGQVLVNLLSNAVKFTDARPGRVTVDVATRDGEADHVFVRVSDTGRGIPRDKQAAIFEPFVQVRGGAGSAYAQPTEGTGLGLAISRDLARGMGGDLRVRSVEGEGSTFTVTLRRAGEAPA